MNKLFRPKMRRYFETWFYSKFSERLLHKAQRKGIKVIEVPAFYTSEELRGLSLNVGVGGLIGITTQV